VWSFGKRLSLLIQLGTLGNASERRRIYLSHLRRARADSRDRGRPNERTAGSRPSLCHSSRHLALGKGRDRGRNACHHSWRGNAAPRSKALSNVISKTIMSRRNTPDLFDRIRRE